MELNVELEKESISRVITNGDPEGQIFYPTLTLVIDSYIMLTDSVGTDQHFLDVLVGLGFYCQHMSPEGLQGSHRLEKYLNLNGFLEKSLKITSALKSTGKITQKP